MPTWIDFRWAAVSLLAIAYFGVNVWLLWHVRAAGPHMEPWQFRDDVIAFFAGAPLFLLELLALRFLWRPRVVRWMAWLATTLIAVIAGYLFAGGTAKEIVASLLLCGVSLSINSSVLTGSKDG